MRRANGHLLVMLALGACLQACRETPRVVTHGGSSVHSLRSVSVGQAFHVGMMEYTVVRVTAIRGLPVRARLVAPPSGSAWVVVEFRRTWRGETSMTAPAMPFELVTRAGLHVAGDVDGLAAHIEQTNCGELGPTRLDPLHDEHNCEVFAVQVGQLDGCVLEPSPTAHRGPQERPVVSLGALTIAP